jgi:ribosomal protein S30
VVEAGKPAVAQVKLEKPKEAQGSAWNANVRNNTPVRVPMRARGCVGGALHSRALGIQIGFRASQGARRPNPTPRIPAKMCASFVPRRSRPQDHDLLERSSSRAWPARASMT